MARPTKSPDEQRTKWAKVRLTPAELAQLEFAATADGLTVSDYVRGILVKSKPRRKPRTPEQLAEIEALGRLGNIRSDLNQILKDRFFHKFIKPEQAEQVLADIEAIADLLLDRNSRHDY